VALRERERAEARLLGVDAEALALGVLAADGLALESTSLTSPLTSPEAAPVSSSAWTLDSRDSGTGARLREFLTISLAVIDASVLS
jgi:hypothetical protein